MSKKKKTPAKKRARVSNAPLTDAESKEMRKLGVHKRVFDHLDYMREKELLEMIRELAAFAEYVDNPYRTEESQGKALKRQKRIENSYSRLGRMFLADAKKEAA